MVFDHRLEKKPVKHRPGCLSQAVYFFGREHAGHQCATGLVVVTHARDLLAADLKPVLHHLDLVFLR